ncbi:FecR family protein [Zobellia laminariae]|uniref:FecR family protein n=1 Tax=Zobellia laminariae TaxID=248906 RepID=UPI003EF446E0
MISPDIENCIVKYFSQAADINDLGYLNKWLQAKENQLIFKEYIKTHFAINLAMNDPNLDKVRGELLREIRNYKKVDHKIKYLSVLKYAAIAIVFLGLGLLMNKGLFSNTEVNTIVPREDVITLKHANGDLEIIAVDGTSQILNEKGQVIGAQKGQQLVYQDQKSNSELKYNTLSIPNGKRFFIVLSDGSKVHLNSGSSITYPMAFHASDSRKVVLTGEAYFDVTPDKNRPFIVNTQEIDIKVYGTKFNVTNYPEDDNAEVVLVEGSVSMSEPDASETKKEEFFLDPGYKGAFSKSDKNIVNQKVNTSLYTSWMKGNFIFSNETFENITRKLERHYNVIIINNNTHLAEETFNATIETDYETIEQVLNYFNKVYKIEYQIVENKIIIN